MPLRAFAAVPERSAVFTKPCWGSWINSFRHVDSLGILLCPQCRQHAFRSKWRFVQTDADGIVDCVCDRRDGGSERAFATFLRAKRALRIDAFDYDGLDFR